MSHPVYRNSVQRAIQSAQKIPAADADLQVKIVTDAIPVLLLEVAGNPSLAWKNLADMLNMSVQLSKLGVGAGEDADYLLNQAQEALAYAHQQFVDTHTWLLPEDEQVEMRGRLLLFRNLVRIQLNSCSLREFETAYKAMLVTVAAAKRGKAGRGVVVVDPSNVGRRGPEV